MKEEQRKQKINTIKTFSVRFTLGELKKDMTLTTKTPSKPSKEQVINQAIKLHSQGNISEAAKGYQYCINQGFNNHKVFNNYGVILNGRGKLKEAESSYRKAIELNPDFADAHCNLALILRDRGNLQESELSTRKAIELNPDYAIAHSHLGNILRDLGKLEELILLSKSTLQSNSINQGYKLLASLRITIANLLQKDFSGTLININKTNELINQGAIKTIKDEKNRKHSFTFSRFITSLYPLLEKDNQHHYSKIPHFGESHCLSFAHQTLSISSQIKTIQPVLITGGKAWHFANKKHNQWKDSLTQQIKNHNYSDEIFISFGEIDCRKSEGIITYALKKEKNISEVCKQTIKGYLDYMEKVLSQNYVRRYYFGVPAPTRKKELPDELDIKRIAIIKQYNSTLKKEVLTRGSYFLDVYALTSNKDGANNNLYMCDQIHLSPKCLSILFKNYLYKPEASIK
ncbi:tetratricopeptide repeat protein [Prochlorococcus sp. MIT 0916]|uniref:tetratricopeptide repeat protein n=1 Tax=Prochlorococcus sp. MIT 0916 TaxID=3082521 RepID=UPI0039B45A8D